MKFQRLYENAHSHFTLTGILGVNCLLHKLLCIFHYNCLKTALCKSAPLSSLSYDLYFVLNNQKALNNAFQATAFKVEENSIKDFSRENRIEGLFKTARTLYS